MMVERWRVALAIVCVAAALMSCGDGQSASGIPAGATPGHDRTGVDPRLTGVWHVRLVRVPDGRPLLADYSTRASLRFRTDGVLITDGERCGAPRFSVDGTHLDLRWPENSECSYTIGGTQRALRIARILENLTTHHQLGYAVQGDTLRVAAAGYRAVLVRALPTSSYPPSIGPSSPAGYTGTARTSPPPH